jgi:hypothetical protein
MYIWNKVALTAAAVTLSAGLIGCSSAANTADFKVGDCLEVGGPADRPTATVAACGSRAANFEVVATVKGEADDDKCPADVDSSYSMRTAFSKSSTTACLDIDWVVGECMSVDPEHNTDPVRVDCNDTAAPHRQRATQILKNAVDVDQCASGVGYAYDERRFTVCVEDMG